MELTRISVAQADWQFNGVTVEPLVTGHTLSLFQSKEQIIGSVHKSLTLYYH